MVHFRPAQLGSVPGGSRNDVGEAEAVERRHGCVLVGVTPPGGDAARVEEFPEQIGRVGVGVAGQGGGDAGVEADEEDEEVRAERVGEQREMGVLGWRGVAGAGPGPGPGPGAGAGFAFRLFGVFGDGR